MDRFVKISSQELGEGSHCWIYLYYDTVTKVMYQFIGDECGGGLCPLYNADGSLMLYEG